MQQQEWPIGITQVAACTVTAAHRRDHQHGVVADECHPHAVEVVLLGDHAVMVCHDCCTDSGFIAHREAEDRASQHRRTTLMGPAPQPPERAEYVA